MKMKIHTKRSLIALSLTAMFALSASCTEKTGNTDDDKDIFTSGPFNESFENAFSGNAAEELSGWYRAENSFVKFGEDNTGIIAYAHFRADVEEVFSYQASGYTLSQGNEGIWDTEIRKVDGAYEMYTTPETFVRVAEAEGITGSWGYEGYETYSSFEIKSDGTGHYYDTPGTWTLEGEKLTFVSESGWTISYIYALKDGVLTLAQRNDTYYPVDKPDMSSFVDKEKTAQLKAVLESLPDPSVVGKWGSEYYYMDIRKDGSAVVHAYTESYDNTYTYTIDGKEMKLTSKQSGITYTAFAVIKDEQLLLIPAVTAYDETYTREGSGDGLIGKWVDDSGGGYEFFENGSVELLGYPEDEKDTHYTLDGPFIQVENYGEGYVYEYTIYVVSGNTLTFVGFNSVNGELNPHGC